MRLNSKQRTEAAHEDAVWTAAWISNDAFLTGSVDETVKVWGVGESLDSQHTYTGHTLGVVSVAVDSSGTYAASSALDSFIRVWNLAEASTKAVMETPPSETWQICFHPTAETLTVAAAGGSANEVTLWSCDTAQPVKRLKFPGSSEKTRKEKFVLSVACSPDGRHVAGASQDGSVCVFDCETGDLLHTLEGHYKPIRSLSYTPDSKMLLTACDDMHCHLYDAVSGSLIEAFSGHESWVLSVSCHPSGTAIATGSSDSRVKLWDLRSRSCAQTVTDHTDQVWSVSFSPDGNQLTSVSDDKSVAVYSFTS